MSIIGHPKVTKQAYEQARDIKESAVRFAHATVLNGLGNDISLLPPKVCTRLIAQVERDFLVATLALQVRQEGQS